MRVIFRIFFFVVSTAVAVTSFAQPQYQIFDIGVVQQTDSASQGINVSPGGVAVGRTLQNNGGQAFSWTQGSGIVGLPNLAGRAYAVANDANDAGLVVGTAADTFFGSNRLPVMWQNGVVSQLPLPPGETIGDATGVNSAGIIVGSVDGGSFQRGVIYKGPASAIITETTSTGCFFITAFGINDAGRIVGFGIDPNNAARNVGIVLDIGQTQAFEVGAIPGANGAICFGVGNGGYVVGSTMMNQGSGTPFIYSNQDGIMAIPLAAGTSEGSARAVNSSGWVVGQDSSAFSIPFLWDRTTTYRLADLLPPGSGWDLSMNTSSSAEGISDDGVIVGTGVHNGETHGYAMVPVKGTPTPTPTPAPGTATHFAVVGPPVVFLFMPFDFTVTAQDQSNNTATSYSGTVHFTTTSTQAMLPADGILTNGSGTFNATLGTSGNQTITATDTVSASITGTSNVIHVIFDTPTPPPTPTATPTPTDTPTPSPTATVPPPTPTPIQTRALNVSTRLLVQAGDSAGIGGFIVTGTTSKDLLFRGIGPSLTGGGITNALPDPTLDLRDANGTQILANNNWRDTQEAEINATGIPPTNDLESAIVATLNPGSYTVVLRDGGSSSGVGLVEIYDLDHSETAKLANLSTRAFVSTGGDIEIAGFILGGGGDDRVIVRGIGPSLTPIGLPNALPDPTLELRDSSGTLLISNNDWQDDQAQAALISAAGLAPTNSLESGIAATLAPGAYTAQLAGRNGGVGVGLVEIYDLGP